MDGTVHHALEDAFQWEEWQTKMLDGFVIASCSLSIMGSLFIFLSYTLWSDLRTTPRFMLVCLSLADLITASGNMFGVFYRQGGVICTIQSAFTSTSSICSFLWTVSIGTHLYLSMLKSTKKRNFQPLYHVISWGLPIVILVIALSFRALGADDFSRAVGWCWISDKVEYPLFWSFFVGKAEEITSYFVTFLLYALTLWRLHRRVNAGLLPSKNVRKVITQVDKKLMLVPLVFIMVRIWGTTRFLLVSAGLIRMDIYWMVVLQGVGDSAQGFANFLLFCVFTKKVRNKYTGLVRRALCWNSYSDLLSSEDEDHNSKAKHSIQYDESPAAPRSFMPGVRVYYSDESEHSLSSSPSSSAAPSGRRL
jgi:G protein-coupled receptor 157